MDIHNHAVYYRDNEYFIRNTRLGALCDKLETPFYLYDMDFILSKYEQLKNCFQWNQLRICYAMKANYNPHLLQVMKEHGFYLDTVSPAEVILAIKVGFEKERILFTANNMTDEEMMLVGQQGVMMNIDSLLRLLRYSECYPGSEVSLRINPEVIAGENVKVQTAGDSSKFGILLKDVGKALKIAHKYHIKIIGLHEHTGSGISDLKKVYQSMRKLLNIANRTNFPELRFIDFGGGFKVPYLPDENAIDYQEFGKKTVQLFSKFCENYGRELALYFEPGKYIVAEAGCLVMRVNTVKNNRGHLILGTDSGFPQMIRTALYGAYHQIINISNPSGKLRKYDICGNICESTDCFAKDRELPEVRVGDCLAILNAGAYCRSMASDYNLRPIPSEYLIRGEKLMISHQKATHTEMAERVMREYGLK